MAAMEFQSTGNEKTVPSYPPGPAPNAQELGYPPSYPGEPPVPQSNFFPGSHTSQLPQGGHGIGVTPPPPPPQQIIYVNQNSGLNSMQSAIPVMPLWCAILLCVVNVLLPGFGTIIASITVFCCSQIPQSGSTKMGVFCINFWIGWCQLLTVWVFLIGWFWSIAWGVIFITLSVSTYGKPQQVTMTTTTVLSSPPQVVIQ